MWNYICKLLCCDFTEIRCRNCKNILNNGTFMQYNKRCNCIASKYK